MCIVFQRFQYLQGVRLIPRGRWVIGLLGYWVIGLLGYWVIGSLGKREGRRDGRKSTCADKEQADKDKKLPVTTTKSNLYT